MNDCIFCKIISRQIPSEFLYETQELIVIKDINPKATIHYLIIPKKHVKDIQALESQDLLLGSKIFHMAQQISKEMFDSKDFKLVLNSGHEAGQRVYHLHMHYLSGQNLSEL